jgi:hypothetical protein
MGFFSDDDDANEFYGNVWRNAENGLDARGRPFNAFLGDNGTVVDLDGRELPKDRYGEYIMPRSR